jgi:sugar/nucleoside kinase (ribokinase family)
VPHYDYTTVGHVTVDVMPDGSRQPGGTAFYSALQAARLGLRARIVTQGDAREIETLLSPYRDALHLNVLPAAHTTTLRTDDHGSERRQRVLTWAGEIALPEVDTAILHFAPVAHETPRSWSGHADFVGLTPQGLVREWGASGEIMLMPLHSELLPERSDAWVLNEREHEPCAAHLARALATGIVAAITDGPRPVALHLPGVARPQRIPVPSIAAPAEDLGAGDVFAAAFFIALFEHQPPARAAAFAAAAAAVRVEGVGPGAVADRSAIGTRLHDVADSPKI